MVCPSGYSAERTGTDKAQVRPRISRYDVRRRALRKESTMEHSKNYDKVKGFYNRKLWDLTRVRNAVVKGWITEEEFAEITGAAY